MARDSNWFDEAPCSLVAKQILRDVALELELLRAQDQALRCPFGVRCKRFRAGEVEVELKGRRDDLRLLHRPVDHEAAGFPLRETFDPVHHRNVDHRQPRPRLR